MGKRRKIGRPLLVVTAVSGAAIALVQCGSSTTSGNLRAIDDASVLDMQVSETSGNLTAPDVGTMDGGSDAESDAMEAGDAPKDARDGG